MSGGKAALRKEEKKKTPRSYRRKYGFAALAAVLVVVILALFLYDNSDAHRYERYRRQATESYQNGDYDRALSDLRKAIAIHPSEDCLMLMADCYEAQGNWEMALETLRRMDRSDSAVTARIDALEQRRRQQQEGELRMVAGESYDPGTTELSLDGRGLGDGVLQEVRQLHALNRLSLADNALEDLSPLEELGGLTELDLSGNAIHDLTPLGKLYNLRSLTLDGNPLEDLSPLYGLSELNTLSLRRISLTEAELAALSAALPRCAILTDGSREDRLNIRLSGVRFDTEATELNLSGLGLRDITCLSLCPRLKWLDLSDNEISDLSPLMNLEKLEQLNVAGNQISDLRPLIGLSALCRVDASRNALSDTAAVGSIQALISLDLSDNPIQDFSGLKKLYNLQSLRLEATGIGDEELPLLYELARLTRLSLDRNPGITDEAMGALKNALPRCTISHGALVYDVELGGQSFRSDVTSLSIEGTELSDLRGFEKFDSLVTVELGRNRIETITVFQNSRSRESIRSLDLSYNQIQDLSPLPALTALEVLDLQGNNISSVRPLLHMTKLKTLVLTGNPLTDEQLQTLRDALPNCEIRF